MLPTPTGLQSHKPLARQQCSLIFSLFQGFEDLVPWSPIFLSKPERAAQHVEKPVVTNLVASLPIFFWGGKGKPQQIRGAREDATAHAHSKRGALQQPGRQMPCRRQPSECSRGQIFRNSI